MVAAPSAAPDTASIAGAAARSRRVLLLLAAVATVLAGLSLVLLRVTPWKVLRDPASPLVQLLDVRAEANLHTWFNVVVLAAGALIHLGVALLARRSGACAWPWLATASVLGLLSLDDLASLHERLEPLGRALGAGDGALHFAWLLPGLALAVGLVLVTVTAVRRLPRPAARWLAAGMAALLAAAFGLEAVGGMLLSSVGDGPAYIVVSHVEELVETCAAALLLCSGLRAVAVRADRATSGLVVAYAPR